MAYRIGFRERPVQLAAHSAPRGKRTSPFCGVPKIEKHWRPIDRRLDVTLAAHKAPLALWRTAPGGFLSPLVARYCPRSWPQAHSCLLYTSDAADDLLCVDL